MDQIKQIEMLERDLLAVINRYKAEFQLSLAGAIGVLEIIKLELYTQQTNDND